MLFTGLGRSVLGETEPSVWVPPSAYGLGQYSRPRAQFLPIRTSQPVNNIYIYIWVVLTFPVGRCISPQSLSITKLKAVYCCEFIAAVHRSDQVIKVPWRDEEIAYVRYIKILTWLRGFRVKIANCEHKENETKYIEYQKWPESLGVTLEF